MSYPVDWIGANKVLNPPEDTTVEQISKLAVYSNGTVCVSCWQLSEEALKEIINTGCIFVSVIAGPSQPPIFVGSHNEVREVCIDYGPVWKLPK
jgi:hypothetical protein